MSEEEGTSPEQSDIYPGPLKIWKNAALSPTEQRIEKRLAEQLQRDLPATLHECRFRNGRILDTDLARRLSEDWNHNNESRARYTNAVHNPSSALIHTLFMQLLADPKQAPFIPECGFILLPWLTFKLNGALNQSLIERE